jgi:DNA-binding HxlR family transcriptional regulator
MKATPGNAVVGLPEPGQERELAMRLYAARTDLYLQILDKVARRQGIRYNEFLGLLSKGGSKNVLTKALRRLQLEGLLTRRGMGDRAGYELTPYGVAVRDAIVEYRAIDRMRQDLPESGPAHAASA